ncbi:MAG: hypothetical protein Ta2A_06010 [Treponemataceae bacterium]|nr:MAG: hypothetical protein Ta2A_06010 [Treponemataceae bacterium]
MNAIAFQSEVKDGVIHIPEEYRGVFSSPVLVTISKDVPHETGAGSSYFDSKKDLAERQAAFKAFSRFKGTLPADFDYKKELFEALDEKYDRAD